jgi:hypothetical protein
VNTLVEAGGEQALGRNHVQLFDARQPREEVEVGWPQTPRIGGAVGDGDDDVAIRRVAFAGE